jgi:DNA modification methylase
LWILGEHRLLCGDSTVEADVKRLMGKSKAALFATDPPYFVEYTGDDRPKTGKDWSGVYYEVDTAGAATFMESFYSLAFGIVKPNAALYLWYANKVYKMIEGVCEKVDILIHQQIIWVKPCILLGYSYYPWRHEPCLLMWRRGKKPTPIQGKANAFSTVWPVGFDKDGDPTTPEYYSDVWELDYGGKKKGPSGIEHPTIKPVEVFAIPMRVHTKPGDFGIRHSDHRGREARAALLRDGKAAAVRRCCRRSLAAVDGPEGQT